MDKEIGIKRNRSIAQQLAAEIKRRGSSQHEVARELDVNYQQLNDWLNGKSKSGAVPMPIVLETLAFLGSDAGDFIDQAEKLFRSM